MPASEIVSDGFARHFAGQPDTVVFAPGRVNLIGEHTDYTGGFVLPVALQLRMWAAVRRRDDGQMRMVALDFGEAVEAWPDEPPPAAGTARWSDYVRGVAWAMRVAGHPIGGFEIALHGEVPAASGLSSSAALCVASARAFAALFAPDIAARDLALLAHRAETGFVGLACGVMDQFASALGDERHALLLDCRSLEYRLVPLPLSAHEAVLVVLDSATPRGLAASAYNQRVAECEQAVAGARRAMPERRIDSLRDLLPGDLDLLVSALDPVPYLRARHVVTENARVLAAVAALEAGDLPALGRLMRASHASLRDDYGVSTAELDWLVEHANALTGVHGARLTGAGFGGCVVVLAERRALAAIEAMMKRYREERGFAGRVIASVGT